MQYTAINYSCLAVHYIPMTLANTFYKPKLQSIISLFRRKLLNQLKVGIHKNSVLILILCKIFYPFGSYIADTYNLYDMQNGSLCLKLQFSH